MKDKSLIQVAMALAVLPRVYFRCHVLYFRMPKRGRASSNKGSIRRRQSPGISLLQPPPSIIYRYGSSCPLCWPFGSTSDCSCFSVSSWHYQVHSAPVD